MQRNPRDPGSRTDGAVLPWLALATAATAVFLVLAGDVFPLMPSWTLSRGAAELTAEELLRDLGEPVPAPYRVVQLTGEVAAEALLAGEAAARGMEAARRHPLARHVAGWKVWIYDRNAGQSEWSYRAHLGLDAEVLTLERRVEAAETGVPPPAEVAREQAVRILRRLGHEDLAAGEPEIRTREQERRTDLVLRFADPEGTADSADGHGMEVVFAGERLAAIRPYGFAAELAAAGRGLRPIILLGVLRIFILYAFLPLAGVLFLRLYHRGEVGVRRGLLLAGGLGLAGVLLQMLASRAWSQSWAFGDLSRVQQTWVSGIQMSLLYFLPMALLVLFCWSVGESWNRTGGGRRLAAVDGLLQGDVANRTVARAVLRGTAAGLGLVAGVLLLLRLLHPWGVVPLLTGQLGPWWQDFRWPLLGLVLHTVVFVIYGELFGRLFLTSWFQRRFGRWAGAGLAILVTAVCLWQGVIGATAPTMTWALLGAVLHGVVATLMFLRWGLLSAVMTSAVVWTLSGALPLLAAEAPGLQAQGWAALVLVLAPMLLTLRWTRSPRTFHYHYDDVPLHVRRIAERERQKVELETARAIQSSILPELPPQLAGVELAHAYEPASEVGGDFYDVMALEDGRLALAIGDVAGHGASSGLIMAMAKSALTVQATVDPGIEAVMATLNRTVHQSARRRLLATLCYLLLDPRRRELMYASAGHLFPYRVRADGGVVALESVAYPLGVRPALDVRPRLERLEAGDLVVLFSDGVVEARAPDGDELFGFTRLEAVLREAAGSPPGVVREAILEAVRTFRGGEAAEDDLTLLVLRVP